MKQTIEPGTGNKIRWPLAMWLALLIPVAGIVMTMTTVTVAISQSQVPVSISADDEPEALTPLSKTSWSQP